MYRTKAIYQLSDLKQSSWKILRLFEIYRQSGSQAPVYAKHRPLSFASLAYLLHIHNSAAPWLCIFAYITLSSDVRLIITLWLLDPGAFQKLYMSA